MAGAKTHEMEAKGVSEGAGQKKPKQTISKRAKEKSLALQGNQDFGAKWHTRK